MPQSAIKFVSFLLKLTDEIKSRLVRSCGLCTRTRISIQAFGVWRWQLVTVVIATIAATHGQGQRSTSGLLAFTYKCVKGRCWRGLICMPWLPAMTFVRRDEFWKSQIFLVSGFEEPLLWLKSVEQKPQIIPSFRCIFRTRSSITWLIRFNEAI